MLAKLRSHLTYANVMVTALMFIVLGGGAYAAFRLPADSVKSKHIAPDAAQGVDINEASLDASVLQSRVGGTCQEGQAIQSVFATGQVSCETALQGQPGTPGAPGAPGQPGAPGADGTSFTWQGAWTEEQEYAPNDVVSHQGSSWIATKDRGEPCEPGSSEDCAQWALLAQQGEQGIQGEQGLRGEQGLPGSAAQFDGAPAGGDLDGTYPDPLIAGGAVGSDEIETGAVRSDEIITDAVRSDEIYADSVGSDEMNDDAVGTTEVATNSLLNEDLADNSVGSSEVAADSVGASEIVNNSINRFEIADNGVGSAELSEIIAVENPGVIGDIHTRTVTCPIGTTVISGGGFANDTRIDIIASGRTSGGTGNGWSMTWRNLTGLQQIGTVQAYCLDT